MIFKYYGQNVHSWDIAKDWNWGRNIEWWKFWTPLFTTVSGYFNSRHLTTETYYCSPPLPIDYDDIFNHIKDWIDKDMPILLAMSKINHAVVIVGYNLTGGSKKVYINDPSGTLMLEFDRSIVGDLPYIAVELNWNDVTPYIGWGSYLIAVGGKPSPPKGTIDITDKGVRFWHAGVQEPSEVYSWLYGLDKGLIWKNSENHALALDSRDYFQFYKYIDNHMKDDQTYGFEIEFASVHASAKVRLVVPVKGRDWASVGVMDPIHLRDLLTEYGEYTITLRLWDEKFTEKYDEVVFPSINFSPLIEFYLCSPADLYITDPLGRHVGVDPSTGQVINEISGTAYTGAGSEPQVIAIPDPLDGNYEVLLIGRATGTYSLTIKLVTLQETIDQTCKGDIKEGETCYYTASVSVKTGEMKVISWEYVFEDEKRGTILKISTDDKLFQFITPDKDYGVREATYMRVRRRTITIRHKDSELRLITLTVDTELDFCIAVAWDRKTHKRYLLVDKAGKE